MNAWIWRVIALILGLVGGGVLGYLIRQQRFQQELGNLEAVRNIGAGFLQ